MMRPSALLAVLFATVAAPAVAHPHVFVDATVQVLTEAGTVTGVRLVWTYDDFFSLMVAASVGHSARAPPYSGVEPPANPARFTAMGCVLVIWLVIGGSSAVSDQDAASHFSGQDPDAGLGHPLEGDLLNQPGISVEVEFPSDVAAPITVAMICAILGIPRDEIEQIRRSTAVLADNSGAATWIPALDPALVERGRRTGEEMTAYFQTYLEERRRHPREGALISEFLTVEVEGERLMDGKVLSMAMLLLLAGNETTTNLIVNFVRLLEAFPDEADRLRKQPNLVPGAVEETLRIRNSIRNVDRFALRDVDLGGVTIPAGGLVVVWLSAANRDPAAFPDPDRFLPDRTGTKRHMGFGTGMHMCLGAPLARMETQTAAREIVRRIRTVELLGPPELSPNASFAVITRQIARFVAR